MTRRRSLAHASSRATRRSARGRRVDALRDGLPRLFRGGRLRGVRLYAATASTEDVATTVVTLFNKLTRFPDTTDELLRGADETARPCACASVTWNG